MTAGTAGSQIAATVPSTCATSGGQPLFVTRCTAASTLETGDFALCRVASTASQPTCSSSGKIKGRLSSELDALLPAECDRWVCGRRGQARIELSLAVRHGAREPQRADLDHDTYIADDIALRNGTHS